MGAYLTIPDGLELTPREQAAFAEFQRKDSPAMSPATAANFFALFAEGFAAEKMLEGNPAWGLGAIVDARIRYHWDEKRETYVEDIHRQALERLSKLRAESINHLADLAVVAHTEFRQQMLRYMQNPIPENLPDARLKSTKDYKDLAEAIEKIFKLGLPDPPQQPTINIGEGGQVAIVMGDKGAKLLQKLANDARERNTRSKN